MIRALRRLALALALVLGSSLDHVARAEPEDQKRACVEASTQGQTERDAGNLLAAKQAFLACSSDACPAVIRKSCVEWLADVEERLPSLVVRVLEDSGSDLTDAQLSIDDQPSPLDGRPVILNPGLHTLRVRDGAGGRVLERKVLLAEKEAGRLISIQLPSAPRIEHRTEADAPRADAPKTPPSSPGPDLRDRRFKLPVGSWVLYGAGAVGLGAFAYFGLTSNAELNSLRDRCSPSCDESETEAGRRAARRANISLTLGAAALVGAGTWTFLAWRQSRATRDGRTVQLSALRGGAHVGIHGRF